MNQEIEDIALELFKKDWFESGLPLNNPNIIPFFQEVKHIFIKKAIIIQRRDKIEKIKNGYR